MPRFTRMKRLVHSETKIQGGSPSQQRQPVAQPNGPQTQQDMQSDVG